ncbi:hypothetical protein HYT32_02025 [Candidatus Roizmanbacteria bacterium]|nr:hypothetical protein [Candidatus Roizmanbacteria bacterium]
MKTIIYYTSNRENPEMEQKIIDDMLSKKGDLPIISVSQKPMDLGRNICVGDVGLSYLNAQKQILIGAELATTDYVIIAESDFLYPPEYFNFKPTGDNIYRYNNVWIMWLKRNGVSRFYKKKQSEGAQIVKREFLIDILRKHLRGYPDWYDRPTNEFSPRHTPYHRIPIAYYGGNPAISIKSGLGVNLKTGTLGGAENKRNNLPYWGDVQKLRAKFS